MFYKLVPKLLLAALIVIAALPGFSQVIPTASQGGLPFTVGGGVPYWDVDWGHGSKFGGATLWIDYLPPLRPKVLHGIGLEAEAHDVHLTLAGLPTNLRQVSVGGGVIYTWHHFQNFSPYAKFEMGLGRDDFPNQDPPGTKPFQHDVLTYFAPGAGLEYRVYRHIWVRAEYEYQRWGPLPPFNQNPTPNGFTFGAMYDFRRHR
jgi:hypothetical protein